MRKYVWFVLAVLVASLFVPAAFAAQGGEPAGGASSVNWIAITAGFSMAIASAGCGYAQARATAAACEGMARNPGAAGPIRAAMILGLVFVETLVLFTLAMLALKG